FQGVVVVLPDQVFEPPLVVRAQHRGRATPVRRGGQRARLTAPLQQPGDEGQADPEQLGDLALGALAVVPRRRDPLPDVHRLGARGRPSYSVAFSRSCPSPPLSPFATRGKTAVAWPPLSRSYEAREARRRTGPAAAAGTSATSAGSPISSSPAGSRR